MWSFVFSNDDRTIFLVHVFFYNLASPPLRSEVYGLPPTHPAGIWVGLCDWLDGGRNVCKKGNITSVWLALSFSFKTFILGMKPLC
jgi:hypothetical protein